jgi:hypothetical protein
MQLTSSRSRWLNTTALFFLFPASYVIVISLLKYGLGIDGPFDASAPFLENMGIKEPPGWNINLIILLGPIIALFIVLFQVLHIRWHFTKEHFHFDITIRKKRTTMTIGIIAVMILASMAFYLTGENCSC